ncbi:MAG: DUF3153 domain-containing protein [Synechococcus sp.]|nr:DUF3153 domain-containing protein [Synechococcus sp.]
MPEHVNQAMGLARRALERGDYRQVLQLLEPLGEQLPLGVRQGGELRLLLATAHQGLGQEERAISCSRAAANCADAQVRKQAQAMLAVLEAPPLQLPPDRLVQLPQLGQMPSLEGMAKGGAARRRRRQPLPPSPPPVGPTRSPLGFAALAVALLLGLTVLLGGCVRVETDFDFVAPGRVRVQQQWLNTAKAAPALPNASALLLAPELEPWLQQQVEAVAELFGEAVPAPQLQWRERNWLLGVQQRLQLVWDLSTVAPVPGLELALQLRPFAPAAVHQAQPAAEVTAGRGLEWQPQPGQPNQLELRCWRWHPLGVGAAVVALLLLFTQLLARLLRAA